MKCRDGDFCSFIKFQINGTKNSIIFSLESSICDLSDSASIEVYANPTSAGRDNLLTAFVILRMSIFFLLVSALDVSKLF